MNQSGTSEKDYRISLHIIFKFMMLALLKMITSNSTSCGCLRTAVFRLPYQLLMHRGFPLCALLGESSAVGGWENGS